MVRLRRLLAKLRIDDNTAVAPNADSEANVAKGLPEQEKAKECEKEAIEEKEKKRKKDRKKEKEKEKEKQKQKEKRKERSNEQKRTQSCFNIFNQIFDEDSGLVTAEIEDLHTLLEHHRKPRDIHSYKRALLNGIRLRLTKQQDVSSEDTFSLEDAQAIRKRFRLGNDTLSQQQFAKKNLTHELYSKYFMRLYGGRQAQRSYATPIEPTKAIYLGVLTTAGNDERNSSQTPVPSPLASLLPPLAQPSQPAIMEQAKMATAAKNSKATRAKMLFHGQWRKPVGDISVGALRTNKLAGSPTLRLKLRLPLKEIERHKERRESRPSSKSKSKSEYAYKHLEELSERWEMRRPELSELSGRIKKLLVVEEYKHERLNRTTNLMEEIDVAKPHVIMPMYEYKLKSQLNFEDETYAMQHKLKEMLKDTHRHVARIERERLNRKRMHKLIQDQHCVKVKQP